MMPADVTLPCVPNVHLFDAVAAAPMNSNRYLRLARECAAICATCDHRAPCLRLNANAPGVVAGLTEKQRAEKRKGAA